MVDSFGGIAFAVQPDEMLADPKLESRARTISAELRCLVCQNQSIDDSDADLAKDLRLVVRERLQAGDDDEAVLDYVVVRYGEFVLLRPRLHVSTLLLWGAPVLLIVGGALYAVWTARRRRTSGPELSCDEEAAIERLLAEREGTPSA
ncbi:cytochrome c-type biogenesis protein [Aureimonas leprariae]|nr:cytochrome c-type biogenesis protein [Aureimonas leprariae]